jgi:chorismate mutase
MSEDAESEVSVTALRPRLERLDRLIVELLAVRVVLATAAIRTRTNDGGEVTDPIQERKVLERAWVWSRELGVPPAVVNGLFPTLFLVAKERFRQERGSALTPEDLGMSCTASVLSPRAAASNGAPNRVAVAVPAPYSGEARDAELLSEPLRRKLVGRPPQKLERSRTADTESYRDLL